MDQAWLKAHVRDVLDYPKPGVVFKDITPLLGAADAFRATVDALAEPFAATRVDKVIGIEARGFVFAPVSYGLQSSCPSVAGKLPREIERGSMSSSGTDLLEIPARSPGELVSGRRRDATGGGCGHALVDDSAARSSASPCARARIPRGRSSPAHRIHTLVTV
jgi:adenine phosphoribosyltransferase